MGAESFLDEQWEVVEPFFLTHPGGIDGVGAVVLGEGHDVGGVVDGVVTAAEVGAGRGLTWNWSMMSRVPVSPMKLGSKASR